MTPFRSSIRLSQVDISKADLAASVNNRSSNAYSSLKRADQEGVRHEGPPSCVSTGKTDEARLEDPHLELRKSDLKWLVQELANKLGVESLGTRAQGLVCSPRGRRRAPRRSRPLRVAASTSFYEAALRLPREGSGFSAELWSRSRLSMTVLRFFGLRASEAALVCLKDLVSIRRASQQSWTCYNQRPVLLGRSWSRTVLCMY